MTEYGLYSKSEGGSGRTFTLVLSASETRGAAFRLHAGSENRSEPGLSVEQRKSIFQPDFTNSRGTAFEYLPYNFFLIYIISFMVKPNISILKGLFNCNLLFILYLFTIQLPSFIIQKVE